MLSYRTVQGWLRFTVLLASGGVALAAPPPATSVAGDGKLEWIRDASIGLNAHAEYGHLNQLSLPEFVLPGGRMIELELSRFEIFTPDARVVVGTDDGDVAIPLPELALFRGRVVGEADSHVFLSLTPDAVNGLVRIDSTVFVISSGAINDGLQPVIYDMRATPEDAFQWADFVCETEQLPAVRDIDIEDDSGRGPAEAHGSSCSQAVIAIETDREFTSRLFGNTTQSAAYAATIFAGMNEIYTRDFDVELVVGFLRVWSTNSDPWNASGTSAQLDQFRTYWRDNMGSVQRDLAHFLSGRSLGGGVAYLGALCSNGIGYGLSANLNGSFPMPLQDNRSSNWDIVVTSHEVGHNFGAPHTHSTNPQIDGCGTGDCSGASNGTIMSYCHLCGGGMSNIRLGFHERIITEFVNSSVRASCVYQSLGPNILTQPTNGNVFCAGESLNLFVTSDAASPSYHWRRNGMLIVDDGNIVGANTASLSIASLGVEDTATNYKCIVVDGNTGCQRTSLAVAVSVEDDFANVTSQPRNKNLLEGAFFQLSVAVDNESNYSFQWYHDGVALSDGPTVGGSDNKTLIVVNAQMPNSGQYHCEMSSSLGGCVTLSNAATVVVNAVVDCLGDLDESGDIDLADLTVLLSNFGQSGVFPEDGDLDDDGDVDLGDLSLLLSIFGTACP